MVVLVQVGEAGSLILNLNLMAKRTKKLLLNEELRYLHEKIIALDNLLDIFSKPSGVFKRRVDLTTLSEIIDMRSCARAKFWHCAEKKYPEIIGKKAHSTVSEIILDN